MSETKRYILLALVAVAVAGAVIYLEAQKPDRSGAVGGDINISEAGIASQNAQERREGKAERYEPAKEITTPDGFINTDGISIEDRIGKEVILVDFWTYSCINCQRTLPHLNAWHKRYSDKGLTIIGIHTPEFEFEEEYANVERAVEKFGIEYPVVLDNDYSTWRSYNNRYWPRKYLIDVDGFIVYDHIGEGSYEETEEHIIEALNERARVLGTPAVVKGDGEVQADAVDFDKVGTPETYLGTARLEYLANLPAQECLSATCTYTAPQNVERNTFALDGIWELRQQEASLKEGAGALTIRFSASKVNLVAGGGEGSVEARIYLDGELVSSQEAGSDVEDATVIFDSYGLYNLIDLRGNYEEHELRIEFTGPGIEAFALTFG